MSRFMPRYALLVPGMVLMAAAAEPGASGWTVVQTEDSPAVMSRSMDGMTVTYAYDPEDYNSLKVAVEPCSGNSWYIKESIEPEGETLAARSASLKAAIAQDMHNARLNCKLPDGVEDRIMTGFDEAYAQFEKLDQ